MYYPFCRGKQFEQSGSGLDELIKATPSSDNFTVKKRKYTRKKSKQVGEGVRKKAKPKAKAKAKPKSISMKNKKVSESNKLMRNFVFRNSKYNI